MTGPTADADRTGPFAGSSPTGPSEIDTAGIDPEAALFGPDNLPYGVFTPRGGPARVGARLGSDVLDLAVLLGEDVFAAGSLNPFLAQGPDRWAQVRDRLRDAVSGPVPPAARHRLDAVTLALPFAVADYVDFYASEHHASTVGRLFRPGDEPLLSNWRHLPVGYTGRAATVVVSGTDVIRPCGQRRGDGDGEGGPVFGPSIKLDLETEVGFVVGVGSRIGERIGVEEFDAHVFGAVLLNDWSARDVQAWEYQPLGPHLGKSFATSISAWVTPMAALDAARVPLPGQHPAPLPYLRATRPWGLDVELALSVDGQLLSRPPYATTYWSPAQMLAHLTVAGAATRTGDLFASGTVSGPEPDQRGCLLELTADGREPLRLPDGRHRTWLLDGEQVTITASAPGPSGTRIGLGEVTGRVLAARP